MRHINKFNIHWQIVRAKVKKIKDVATKIELVESFLINNASYENYGRVHNWMSMSRLGYKNQFAKNLFTLALERIDGANYCEPDNCNNLCGISSENLLLVYKDLSKRKHGFFFNNKAPKSHIVFMKALTSELEDRNLL